MDSENDRKFLAPEVQAPRGRKWKKDRMKGKDIGTYSIHGRIGHGGTSVVYMATCGSNVAACKITDGKFCDGLRKEFDMLRRLNHANIVKVFDCISCNRIVAMSTEYVNNGDLHDYILNHWPVPSDMRRMYTQQLLSAVEHMHNQNIAHCDLKLENMLLLPNGNMKIIDFSSALKISDATYEDFAFIATTPEYLPPEIFCATADESYDIRAIDEWSVGIVLFIMLTGRFPFGEVEQSKIAKYIKKMRSLKSFSLRQSEERFIYFEQDYLEILRGFLAFEPNSRLSVSKALTMDYLSFGLNIEDIEKEIDEDFESIFDDI